MRSNSLVNMVFRITGIKEVSIENLSFVFLLVPGDGSSAFARMIVPMRCSEIDELARFEVVLVTGWSNNSHDVHLSSFQLSSYA